MLNKWCLLLLLVLLGEIGIRGGKISILWDSPVKTDWVSTKGQERKPWAHYSSDFFLYLLPKGFNFSSSGREDVDVRTLGNGKMAAAAPGWN